jgi:hypothetical protein
VNEVAEFHKAAHSSQHLWWNITSDCRKIDLGNESELYFVRPLEMTDLHECLQIITGPLLKTPTFWKMSKTRNEGAAAILIIDVSHNVNGKGQNIPAINICQNFGGLRQSMD